MRGAVVAGLLAVVCACTVSTGQRGKLGFAYRSADTIVPLRLDSPIATGSEIDVIVYAPTSKNPYPDPRSSVLIVGQKNEMSAGKVKPVPAKAATSSDPSTVKVVSVADGELRLRGVRPGVATIAVETSKTSDLIEVRVADIAFVELDHWSWKFDDAPRANRSVLLSEGTAHLWVERKGHKGQLLVGDGVGTDVVIEPSSAATIVGRSRDQLHLRIKLSQPGKVALKPKKGTGLVLDVVELSNVAKLELEHSQGMLRPIATLEDGRRVLGLEGVLVIASQTPEVCDVQTLSELLGDGAYLVKRHIVGLCRIGASLGALTDVAVIAD